jgi:phosphatidylserine decarboxylase
MFVTVRNKRTMMAMKFAGGFVATTLVGSGLVAADPAKTVPVNYHNGSSVPIQVFLYDEVQKLTVVKYNEITSGGSGSAHVAVKYDGNVDLTYRVYVKNAKGVFDGEPHCKAIKTSAGSASTTTELAYEKLSKC